MNRCPITYEECGEQKYSSQGVHLLSKKLHNLKDFPYTSKEQIQKALELASKLSIQGVQPKLSAIINPQHEMFEIVERGGRYIIKPPHHIYEELPQNEDLTMKLASEVQIETPQHGMMYNIDNSLSYFVKRFDRLDGGEKVAAEDFSQLIGGTRETKYESSMEQVAAQIDKHCTFPFLEKRKLFRLVLFNFLVGNEDMHLKNFTLLRRDARVFLSPAYDLVNTTIVLKTKEEIALPLRGKKSRLRREDLIDYFGQERLGLPQTVIQEELVSFETALSRWEELLIKSFLSEKAKEAYRSLIKSRWDRFSR